MRQGHRSTLRELRSLTHLRVEVIVEGGGDLLAGGGGIRDDADHEVLQRGEEGEGKGAL